MKLCFAENVKITSLGEHGSDAVKLENPRLGREFLLKNRIRPGLGVPSSMVYDHLVIFLLVPVDFTDAHFAH
jgi:hypothetical protein